MALAAGGLRGELADSVVAGFGLAFKADALWVGTGIEGVDAETGAGIDIGGGLMVSDAVAGLSADVRVRMLLVHQDQEFRDRGVSLSFVSNPPPLTPFGFMAKVTPSWGGQATSGAQALWGQETMAGVVPGGAAAGGRLEAELGYGMPVGGRWVGMPSFGIGASGIGRDYRLGYGLTVARAALRISISVSMPIAGKVWAQGTAEHGVGGQLTARW